MPPISPRTGRLGLPTMALALLLVLSAMTALSASPATARVPVEDYASYQPATRCSPKPKPGAVALSQWMVDTYGGGSTSISRACGDSTSEHTEGRAVDWPADVGKVADRKRVGRFLHRILRTDQAGEDHAWARRMGVMYVIWDDTMYAAWDRFEPKAYLSSSCKKRRSCSKTLRHRDHVHVSLTRQGGKGRTSWYDARH